MSGLVGGATTSTVRELSRRSHGCCLSQSWRYVFSITKHKDTRVHSEKEKEPFFPFERKGKKGQCLDRGVCRLAMAISEQSSERIYFKELTDRKKLHVDFVLTRHSSKACSGAKFVTALPVLSNGVNE